MVGPTQGRSNAKHNRSSAGDSLQEPPCVHPRERVPSATIAFSGAMVTQHVQRGKVGSLPILCCCRARFGFRQR